MILPADIGGDEDLARRILVRARSIAPCIFTFADDSEEAADAIAILRGVFAEAPAPGSRRVKSQRVGGAAVDYELGGGLFTTDDIGLLRALCASTPTGGVPVGSFPPAGILTRLWPEYPCTLEGRS